MGYEQAENDFMKFLQTHLTLKDLHPAKADSDVWVRHNGDTYE